MTKPTFRSRSFAATLIALAFLAAPPLPAETVQLQPVADTSLHEIFPENNFGAFSFVHGGLTAKNTATRGLFRFDLAGALPAGAIVTGVTLEIRVVFAAPAPNVPEVAFDLHRVSTAWDEGTKDAGAGFSGRLAGTGEATWRHSMKPQLWQTPGGDFFENPTSSAVIGEVGSYTFPSTQELVADVQAWLDDPAQNHGWILKSSEEDVIQSAKRFGSSESATPPVLIIEYSTASTEIVITSIRVEDGEALLEWSGGSGPYQVQKKEEVTSAWEDAGEATSDTQARFPADAPACFFRVLSLE